ncbi:uncharacterized protein LOC133192414 [Saccostrea echinata]|uniref:uncharacterized protein LOC133192414 n=1 Tax=Saccostrea echinata TaxID=191078 RepID=UPI002A7ED161|nr:uncharacterized protein LOC133192414 [Saccostrea echinata]
MDMSYLYLRGLCYIKDRQINLVNDILLVFVLTRRSDNMSFLLTALTEIVRYILTPRFIVLGGCLISSDALLFSVIGLNPPHLDPFLATRCLPIRSATNAKVKCTYKMSQLVCTQTCNDGFALDDGTRTSSLTCDTYNSWKIGKEFQMCRVSSGTGTGSGNTTPGSGTGTQTRNCHQINSIKDCPSDGDFADCHRCDHFISCAPDGVFLRRCPATTYWDDIAKQCLTQSSTCKP